MALIERLMHIGPDEKNISVHEFAAAMYEVAFGPRTLAQLKAHYQTDVADDVDIDALAAKVTGSDLSKFRQVFEFEQVFILAEHGRFDGLRVPLQGNK